MPHRHRLVFFSLGAALSVALAACTPQPGIDTPAPPRGYPISSPSSPTAAYPAPPLLIAPPADSPTPPAAVTTATPPLQRTLSAATTDASTSGVEGQVLIGPMCPVMQVNTPCPDQPFQATITVLDEKRNTVTQFESDELGNFKIGLRPGAYILVPESPNRMARAGEQTITVIEGQFIRVTIKYDSGIR